MIHIRPDDYVCCGVALAALAVWLAGLKRDRRERRRGALISRAAWYESQGLIDARHASDMGAYPGPNAFWNRQANRWFRLARQADHNARRLK